MRTRHLIGTLCGKTWSGYYGLRDFDVKLPRHVNWEKLLREQSGDFEQAHFHCDSYVELRRTRMRKTGSGYVERVRFIPLKRLREVRLLLTDGKES